MGGPSPNRKARAFVDLSCDQDSDRLSCPIEPSSDYARSHENLRTIE